MPDFDPDPWNAPDPWDLTTPDLQPLNNCYDYATDNRTEWHPPMAFPVPNPEVFWSVPGRTKGVTPAIARGALVFGATVKVLYEYTCEGVRTGAILDGLKKLEDDGSCAGDCWKVAYFIRPYNTTNGGDFHWARQDSDGGWSHKRGTGPVQRLNAPAPPSTTPAPEAENAVPGYEFCGYLCCCPDTRVAALPPEETEGAGETAMLAIFEGQSGSPLRIALGTEMFTLYGDVRKGRRPSFISAARPETAMPLYQEFLGALRGLGLTVTCGEFGAMMAVEIHNDGPVTLLLERPDIA